MIVFKGDTDDTMNRPFLRRRDAISSGSAAMLFPGTAADHLTVNVHAGQLSSFRDNYRREQSMNWAIVHPTPVLIRINKVQDKLAVWLPRPQGNRWPPSDAKLVPRLPGSQRKTYLISDTRKSEGDFIARQLICYSETYLSDGKYSDRKEIALSDDIFRLAKFRNMTLAYEIKTCALQKHAHTVYKLVQSQRYSSSIR